MDYHETIDPWLKTKITATQSYCVEGSLFTIPFVHTTSADRSCELTLLKSQEKFFDEFRQLPEEFFPIFDDKNATSFALNTPVKPDGLEMRMYFQEGSSQHMSTILEGIEATGVQLSNADLLITSETLNRIAGTVFNQQNSWRLRASIEHVYGKNMIVICDDDLVDEAPPTPALQFCRERTEAAVLAQSICDRDLKRQSNKLLHGTHAVMATISVGEESIRMVVVGEVDMIVEKQPINTFVSTGIGRSNRVALGSNNHILNTCYEYLWSRSFWLGISHCLFGMRPKDEDDVQFIQRFSLTDFFRQHRHRNDKLADTATHCVANVLLNLKRAILTEPRSNWLIEYEGKGAEHEPGFVNIHKAEESWSFLLVKEKFHLMKVELIKMKLQASSKRKIIPKEEEEDLEIENLDNQLEIEKIAEQSILTKEEPEPIRNISFPHCFRRISDEITHEDSIPIPSSKSMGTISECVDEKLIQKESHAEAVSVRCPEESMEKLSKVFEISTIPITNCVMKTLTKSMEISEVKISKLIPNWKHFPKEERNKKSKKNEEKSEKKGSKRHRHHSLPISDFQQYQKPLVNHSSSDQQYIAPSERYQRNYHDYRYRDNETYRYHPYSGRYTDFHKRRSDERIPVTVRTVNADSRSSSSTSRSNSFRDELRRVRDDVMSRKSRYTRRY